MAEEEQAAAESQTDAEEAQAEEAAAPEAEAPAEGVEVQEAELPEVPDSPPRVKQGQIDILLDTTMPVEIRLGEVDLEVRDLLQIGPGSVVTLEKQVGEPLDLFLKGVRFATGQLVVTGNTLGVRILQILPRRRSDRQPMASEAEQQSAQAQPGEPQAEEEA